MPVKIDTYVNAVLKVGAAAKEHPLIALAVAAAAIGAGVYFGVLV
jgi:hypothetical protein